MKRFELKKKDWLSTSVFRIALVENPAIETDFIFLSKEDKPIQLSIQEEKRMIYSPVLIPDKVIPRVTDGGEPYEIYLSGDTIEEIARDYMLAKTTLGDWNSEHDESLKLVGVDVVENWIVEDPTNDKAAKLGFKVPAKTWMQGTYISNDEVWAKIKDGTYKGISIEADMAHELINLSINNSEMSETNKLLGEILIKLGMKPSEKTKLASVDVGEGVLIYAESFEEGVSVFEDEAMTVPAEGTFEVDGKTMTVEGGVLVSITEMEDLEEKEEKFDSEAMQNKIAEIVGIAKMQAEASVEMGKENESLKTELGVMKVALAKIEAETKLNTEKLAKVSDVQPKSVTKLNAIETNSVANYLNNRVNY